LPIGIRNQQSAIEIWQLAIFIKVDVTGIQCECVVPWQLRELLNEKEETVFLPAVNN